MTEVEIRADERKRIVQASRLCLQIGEKGMAVVVSPDLQRSG